jgi:hypothetical protein
MRKLFYSASIIISLIITFTGIVVAERNYEDYRDRRYQNRRDRPLSEIRTGTRDDLLDEMRGAVRDEIDSSIHKERRASKRNINESKLIKDIREIIREEIEDAIRIKEKRFLAPWTIEIGGFISYQSKGLESSDADHNSIINFFPMINYFFHKNIAVNLQGEAAFNLTTDNQVYNLALGPVFVFGLDKDDSICFYASIVTGASVNTALENKWGYKYGNEIGLKFILTSGVILNVGTMIVFDNSGDEKTGFQNIIVPKIGITAWF